eukprot:TRINITY_DN4121_c0_g1_i1.p1 TRINITY_DN4121_c0_g1~~TRINITY_DN4121_c0_g1_i1.p1  ORF type:complete len:313 (-),score=20.55 TRINITY_DN4121_c0_g1_i1:728-1537(-)
MLQCVIGHPLDTVKVCLQNCHASYLGVSDCIRRTLQNEGVRGFFKGLSAPVAAVSFQQAMFFSVNGATKRVIATARGKDPGGLMMAEIWCAAWLAAPLYCLVLAPVDRIKTRLQVQNARNATFRGPFQCVVHTLRYEGVCRGLYRGYGVLVMTRLVGTPVQLCSYSYCKNAMSTRIPQSTNMSQAVVAGWIGGCLFWASTFPVDLVKTRVQACGKGTTAIAVVRDVWRVSGIRGFYRGFSPCLLRAGPANAIKFLGVEATLQVLGYSPF